MRDMHARRFATIVAGLGFRASDRDVVFVDETGLEVEAALHRYADGSWHIHRRETLKRLYRARRTPPQTSGADDAATPPAPLADH